MHYERRYVLLKRRKRMLRCLKMSLYLGLLIIVTTGGYRGYQSYVHKREVEEIQKRTAEMECAIQKLGLNMENASAEVGENAERHILPKLSEFYYQNSDIAGWLSIPDTEVDYPVMYLEGDNDYYLSHSFNKENDRNGLLVLDKRCDPSGDDVNWLIHGHNMKSGAMFGTLKKYRNKEYYVAHPIIELATLYEERKYEIVAVFTSSVNDKSDDFEYYEFIQINDADSFDKYISSIKEIALYDTEITATWGDKLVTLSTCEYSKENGRLVIVGRQVK